MTFTYNGDKSSMELERGNHLGLPDVTCYFLKKEGQRILIAEITETKKRFGRTRRTTEIKIDSSLVGAALDGLFDFSINSLGEMPLRPDTRKKLRVEVHSVARALLDYACRDVAKA